MEYIGASGRPMKFEVPINKDVDFYYILGFAVDASRNGTYNNGNFVELWSSDLTPDEVAKVKEENTNVRVLMSLCGWSINNVSGLDQPLFWYDPEDKAKWLNNAFSSIMGLVKRYNLDGIDVDYENFHYPNNFSSTMGELLARLRKEEEVKVVSIAPFNWMIPSYIELFQAFNESIDYVNYQFYADGVPNATEYLATYNKKAQTFGVDKMIPSYEINGRGVQGQAWWDSLALIHAHNPIPGLMIWSADESAPLHYYYEIQAQELLANGTYS
ncbi:hypothetical protein L7F22_050042 [Adiantum nelumboides]|nr:hypothetical protein [Adiantum nelumboides]